MLRNFVYLYLSENVIFSVLSSHDGPSRKPEPARIWSNHSLPVTDIHVGRGGYRCRVVSASLDQTCRVIPSKAIEPVQEILVSIACASSKSKTSLHIHAFLPMPSLFTFTKKKGR